MPNSINITNNLTSTSIPELYIRYFNPKININTDIIISYYVSDSTQEDFLRNTNTKSFTTIVKIGNDTFSQTTNAGEYSINIGSISTTGETYFSIYTIDENGVASVEQFFDILIIDSSYTITSSQTYTMVESDLTKYNITVGESVSNTIAQSNNTGLNNLFNDVKDNGYRKIIMLNRIYMLDYHGDKIMPPSEFTVDMNNATFKATQCTDINVANLVDLRDCFDTHVVNGNLVGNYDGFDFATTQSTTGYYIPGEGLAVAEMNGAKYSSFENMDMSYSVGYNLGVFGGKNAGYVGTAGGLKFSNAYYINGENTVNSDVLSTTDLIDITGILDRGELQCSVYLNYGGLKLNRAELFIHFYNSSSNYMTTVKTRQYQMVKIPNGATQVRVTGFTTSSADNSGLSICHTGYSKNCELINIKSHNTRTCAMHPGIYNHLLIKDCTFNRVADENEYKVTKLALDFEDGYENGRNLFFINNEVYEGTSALTIQRCFNANIIGCRNFGLDTRGHIKGAYIKNNFFNNGDIYTTNFDSQSHLKLINNTFFKTLNFLKWDDTGNYDSIGLTELDCKNGYTNNKNCTLFIRNESSGSGGSGGTDTPSSYTITNNLTNCTTNNNNESVSSNSSYSATITANTGYVIASIVVTMGGADISDTVVSENNINISNVTGNIVITAQAKALPNITLFDKGLIEGYTISNGANYEVSNVIKLNHGPNTYFGFDQSVTFNSGDSINFVINTCGSDASAYITRVCYLDNDNVLQGYDTAVTDDVVSANLPYTLTRTFNSTTTIKPALMKYFGNITISKVYVIRAGNSGNIEDDGSDDGYLITYNLTNCISTNVSENINSGASYYTNIIPNTDYTISGIIVTMGGVDITDTVVDSNNNINISSVNGDIMITATAQSSAAISYIINYNLVKCVSSNKASYANKGSSYSTSITANSGYTLENIIVTMDGVDITSSAVSNNNINIPNVTGNIVIAAEATTTSSGGSSGDGPFSVTYYLTDCTSTNTQTSVAKGEWYYSNIMVGNEGDTISYIKVTMGGVDITSSVVDANNAVYITEVTGDIVITASVSSTSGGTGSGGSSGGTVGPGPGGGSSTYTVTYNLSNCYTDSSQTSVSSGDYYYTNILPNSNYTISSAKVTMGGIDVTSKYLSNNAVYITNVTGNIVITATATANSTGGGSSSGGSSGGTGGTSGYTITYNLSNCYTDSTQKTINAGDFYYTNVYANDNYTISNVSVTMGGVNVTSSAVDSNNVVYITNVTGNIVINATAVYGSGSSSGGSTGGGTIIGPGTGGGIIVAPDPGGGSTGGGTVGPGTGGSTTTYYSITYRLTYCSSYSSVSSIASGSSYYTTITPNSGYTMSNISVTMGGTNITSSVVSGNGINIYNVTGNVIITATATANVTQTYTNPTVTFNYGKAIVTQDGYTETFDLSYTQNTGYSGYSSSYSVSGNGQTHYLTLSNSGTSKFRINGKYPTSGGWMSTTSSDGGTYGFGKYPICYYNNGGWTYSMTNVNNSVPSALLNTALKYFNATFSELNLSANGGTESTIELADYDETWAGVTTRYSRHFEVKLNRRVMTRDYGAYGSSTTANNKWTSTTVHELGHTLGLIDNASHLPSIYDYSRDKTKCLYLQANDVYALKYFLKNNFGVNITTGYDMNYETNYDIAPISAYSLENDIDETDAEFNFDYEYYEDNELEEIADVIVKCKLKYQTTDKVDIHNSENDNFYLDYNVYEINVEEAIKGELKNKLLKIHISENVEIDEDKTYKLYLVQYENTPCSLVNIKQGISEVK